MSCWAVCGFSLLQCCPCHYVHQVSMPAYMMFDITVILIFCRFPLDQKGEWAVGQPQLVGKLFQLQCGPASCSPASVGRPPAPPCASSTASSQWLPQCRPCSPAPTSLLLLMCALWAPHSLGHGQKKREKRRNTNSVVFSAIDS